MPVELTPKGRSDPVFDQMAEQRPTQLYRNFMTTARSADA